MELEVCLRTLNDSLYELTTTGSSFKSPAFVFSLSRFIYIPFMSLEFEINCQTGDSKDCHHCESIRHACDVIYQRSLSRLRRTQYNDRRPAPCVR